MEPVNNKKVKFSLVRTELIECELDREEFDSFFLDIFEDPDTTDEDKNKLKKETDRVWEKMMNRKKPLIFHHHTPHFITAQDLWGYTWCEDISGYFTEGLAKTYKEIGRILENHFGPY